jgi:DNA-binding CsgD family transcriptional regulator/tetratricopeptide (TPR) repeat protein
VEKLLEREAELRALNAIVESAERGRGAVALVRGEAGIGKTSLLRAARERAGVPFHIGRGEPLSVPEPLGPVRELAAAVGAADLPERIGGDRRGLARTLRTALTANGPAVGVIEDAHWADPATLDVVRLLARRAEDTPLALVITFRDDELAANPPLAVLIGDLATDASVTQIVLGPLSLAAVSSLAAASGADAVEVARVTAGNPFLVVETLAAGGRLPASVLDATVARVARLGPEARGIVDIAAVIGQRLPLDLLREVALTDEDALEEALDRGVLTDDGATLGFRHELTRQAIEQSLSSHRRAALHARVAGALVGRSDVDHARIAHHADAAGLSEVAAHHAALAAEAAERVGALREASLQLERALRLGGDLPSEVRVDLLIRYARSANFAGWRLEEARAAAEEAVALGDASRDWLAGGRARTVLSATLWSLDRVVEARAAAAEALALLEGGGDLPELARAHAAVVRIEAIAFDPVEAIARGRRALDAAADAGLEEARIDVLISLGLAHGHRGSPDAAGILDTARRDALQGGTAIQVIRAHVNSVAVAGDARDAARVDTVVETALNLFDDFETTIPRQVVHVLRARSLLDRGRYDEALAELAVGRRDWHGEVVIADAIEALVHARRGEGRPREQLEAAQDQLQGLPPGWRHLFVRAALAEVAWLAGDLDGGAEFARAGMAAPSAAQLVRPASDALLWAMRCGAPITLEPEASSLPPPVRLELDGDWRSAIRAWRALDAPYEAALAALAGDERAAREAVAVLKRLGARAASRAFARERRRRGGASLRGPRRTTLANAAGLTRREQEVLTVLAQGATNPQIAAGLHLSERTVAHHVSSILGKLSAPTRTAAVEAARRAGLLGGKDGPPVGQT